MLYLKGKYCFWLFSHTPVHSLSSAMFFKTFQSVKLIRIFQMKLEVRQNVPLVSHFPNRHSPSCDQLLEYDRKDCHGGCEMVTMTRCVATETQGSGRVTLSPMSHFLRQICSCYTELHCALWLISQQWLFHIHPLDFYKELERSGVREKIHRNTSASIVAPPLNNSRQSHFAFYNFVSGKKN